MNGPDAPPAAQIATPVRRKLERAQRRQLLLITAAAAAIFFGMRVLPTGTNLSHMDFRVDPRGGRALEFCDPANPQFVPVVAVRSPVVMTIATGSGAVARRPVHATVALRTASDKPVGPEDLLYAHTRKMHLLIVDEALEDYQHVHPEPGRRRGEWEFTFTPDRGGTYRVFADFTPAATGRSLYASVDLKVAGGAQPTAGGLAGKSAATPAADAHGVERDGYRFSLTPSSAVIRAREPAELALAISRADGGAVALEPVMDALAHLVAFDESRSGFAHLHPAQTELDNQAGPTRPVLRFKLTIPASGRYVIWAQMSLAGRETFVPFWFEVVP